MSHSRDTSNAFIRKLERFAKLSNEDKRVLQDVILATTRQVEAHADIIREGERPIHVNLMLSGWACRYKQMEDGRRQIVAFFLPGDLCDLNIFVLREMDHSVGALTPVTFAELTRAHLEEITLNHPRVTQALWWDTLVTTATQREWTANIGQRQAFERMSHLFCEIYLRLDSVGLVSNNSCELPLTQNDLGDATGLSTVHVNRTLQEMRAAKLIVLRDRTLSIPDIGALMGTAMFNSNYLHLDHEGRHLDAND